MLPSSKEISDPAVMRVTPTVSVVMLAYNHAAFIAEAIEGVVMQKADFPIELVIGVDCSPDDTLGIALQYQKTHPNLIRLLVPEQRLGMHDNCFISMGACRGKYLAFCEGDDVWIDSDKLAKQVQVMEDDPGLAGCFHECYVLQQKTGIRKLRVGERRIDPKPDTASLIREKNITTCSMLFRRCISLLELAHLTTGLVQIDYMICLLVSEQGPWQYLPHPMAVYRVHSGGIWGGASAVKMWRHNVNFWEALIVGDRFARYRSLVRTAARDQRRCLSVALAREGRLLGSLYHYGRSIVPRRPVFSKGANRISYWRVLVRAVARRLGIEGRVVRLWHKLAGLKPRGL